MTKKQFLLPLLLMSTFFATQAMALKICDSTDFKPVELRSALPCYLGYEAEYGTSSYAGSEVISHEGSNIMLTLKNNTTRAKPVTVSYYANCTSLATSPSYEQRQLILPASDGKTPTITKGIFQSNCTNAQVKAINYNSINNYENIYIYTTDPGIKPLSSTNEQIDIYGEEN